MKKLQLFVCALLLGTLSINAQKKKTTKKSPQKIQFGIRAGGNISKISGYDYNYVFSNKIAYFGGIVAKYPLSKTFSLQGEAYYNLIGSKAKNHEGKQPFKDNENIDYISIPVMAQYKFSPTFYAETGPEIGINLSAKHKDLETGEIVFRKTDTKNTTFFWGIGAGYFLTENLAANFRANIGLTTPFFETGVGAVDHFRMNNFQLGLVYLF